MENEKLGFTKLTPDSSSVSKLSYNGGTKVFTIEFKNGTIYDYNDVSLKDAQLAYNSSSYGSIARKELGAYKGVKRG